MEQCARQFCNHFMDQDSNKIDLELKDIFSRYANDVIASTAFGLKVDSLKEKNNEFYVMGKRMANFEDNSTLKFFLYDVLTTPMKVSLQTFITANCYSLLFSGLMLKFYQKQQ